MAYGSTMMPPHTGETPVPQPWWCRFSTVATATKANRGRHGDQAHHGGQARGGLPACQEQRRAGKMPAPQSRGKKAARRS